ncbi:amidohydrolase family protein [Sphingomonas sp. LY54]|uniref:N-acyl-D-amino-acid deacylase family protein n=1 Tax=Sphingomonas sp. LY54 TaxID=3095343 RepID=UPI002D79C81D|nr:amidohydrolase family protein [Sphingomonas sp. LY54]WRP27955.1 amidohydrolase family protein [Sphingomonas sp. LY54]
MKWIALLPAATLLGCATPAAERVDLIIRGGTIYNGSDAPFVGDVAVSGDRIKAVGKRLDLKAERVVDARGLIVAPGFIDPHAHLGAQLADDDAQTRLVPGFLMQGVTTAFIGNDGGGEADVGLVLGRAAAKPVGINYGAFVGFGPVRKAVIGEADRAPTPDELARMRQMVATAMCQGALGFSTGLFYAPQSFAAQDEVVALAREAGARGGVYDSHIRDESSYSIGLAAAVDEAIAVGRGAGMPVNISHIKALGVDVHGQAPAIIARVEAAQRSGQKVTADQYPWSASGTSLAAALVPRWAHDGGRAAMLRRFDDASVAARLRTDMTDNLRRRGGAESLLITQGKFRAKRLSEIATEMKLDPVATAMAVIRISDTSVASFNQTEEDIAAFMRRPWVMTGSDASGGHPRAYGSFARKYAHYVREQKVLDLRTFIERSTALPADTFGIADRGRLRAGAFADIVTFDPKTFAARATYEEPTLLATGVRTVLVNGVPAVENGALTGTAAGRGLKHVAPAGRCQ